MTASGCTAALDLAERHSRLYFCLARRLFEILWTGHQALESQGLEDVSLVGTGVGKVWEDGVMRPPVGLDGFSHESWSSLSHPLSLPRC